jgi:hypothetical protein
MADKKGVGVRGLTIMTSALAVVEWTADWRRQSWEEE